MRKNWIYGVLLVVLAVSFTVAIFRLPIADEATFILDSTGCAAAQRFGETVEVMDGICSIRAEYSNHSFIRLKSDAKISWDHVVGVKR
jgi:hypothetical protein